MQGSRVRHHRHRSSPPTIPTLRRRPRSWVSSRWRKRHTVVSSGTDSRPATGRSARWERFSLGLAGGEGNRCTLHWNSPWFCSASRAAFPLFAPDREMDAALRIFFTWCRSQSCEASTARGAHQPPQSSVCVRCQTNEPATLLSGLFRRRRTGWVGRRSRATGSH